MTGRACAKEEQCCAKAITAIETHEANLEAGNYEGQFETEWRAYIRDVIDRAGKRIDRALTAYVESDLNDPPPTDDD